jgi:hypothetical protein
VFPDINKGLGYSPEALKIPPGWGGGGGAGGGVSDSILDAIQRQEGWHPGSISYTQNNPGNIKWGAFAQSMGATGPGRGGHAIFPSYEAGRAALKRLIETKGAGQSLSQISRWYAEGPQGGAHWAAGVSRFAGVDPSYVPSARQQPPAGGTAMMEGDITPPGTSGGRFNVPRGSGFSGERETITLANGQQVSVNKLAAAQFKGFFNDLITAGAPVSNLGGYGLRPGNPSQHPAGLAIDWAQSSRNVVSPAVARWIRENPEVLNELERKWGMSGGEHWRNPDTGHFSIETLFGSKHLAELGKGEGPSHRAGGVPYLDVTPGVDRRELDRMQARAMNATKVEGTGKLTVDVNAPRGTSVSAEGGGLFKKTEVTRRIQMDEASSGPSTPRVAGGSGGVDEE